MGVTPVWAEETPKDIKGLYLLTDYPAVTVSPQFLGLQNYNLPPEAARLSGVPSRMDRHHAGRRPAVAQACSCVSTFRRTRSGTRLSHDRGQGPGHQREPSDVTLAKDLGEAQRGAAAAAAAMRGRELRVPDRHQEQLGQAPRGGAGRRWHRELRQPGGRTPSPTTSRPIEGRQAQGWSPPTRSAPAAIPLGRPPRTPTAQATKMCSSKSPPKLELRGRDISSSATAGAESTIPVVVTNSGTSPSSQMDSPVPHRPAGRSLSSRK